MGWSQKRKVQFLKFLLKRSGVFKESKAWMRATYAIGVDFREQAKPPAY
jgi:hypothetical protein